MPLMPPIAVADRRAWPTQTSRNRPTRHEQKEQRGEIAEREIGADAEIDAAGNQAERHAERDEAKLGETAASATENCRIRNILELWPQKYASSADHERKGDHRLEPLLQQQFRKQ